MHFMSQNLYLNFFLLVTETWTQSHDVKYSHRAFIHSIIWCSSMIGVCLQPLFLIKIVFISITSIVGKMDPTSIMSDIISLK